MENVSLKDADEEQSKLVNKLSEMNKGKIPVDKRSFLINVIAQGKRKILNNSKSKIFPIKYLHRRTGIPDPTPEPTPAATPEAVIFDTPKPTKNLNIKQLH